MIYMPITSASVMQSGCNMANVKIEYKGFSISIAMDDSCGALPNLSRTEIVVFNKAGVAVTHRLLGENSGRDSSDLKKIMDRIDQEGELDRSRHNEHYPLLERERT
jgi:hypothetical protein